MTGVTTEALAAAKGTGLVEGALKERQPALVAFVEQQFGHEGSFAKKLSMMIGPVFTRSHSAPSVRWTSTFWDQRSRDGDEGAGRNEPCLCGSGKKFKKCHGAPGGAAA